MPLLLITASCTPAAARAVSRIWPPGAMTLPLLMTLPPEESAPTA